MKCSICKTNLKTNNDNYYCPNPDCESFGMSWDKLGYIYHDEVFPKKGFIEDNPFAFDSNARQEFAMKNYPDTERTVFIFWPFKWKLHKEYIIDKDGELSETIKTIKTLIKKRGYYQLWENPFHLFKRVLIDFKSNKNNFLESNDMEAMILLLDSFNPPHWDKRWGRKVASWWLKITNRKLYNEIRNQES